MIDVIRVNSKSLWCLKHKKDHKKISMFNLGFYFENSFIIPFIKQKGVAGLYKPLLKNDNYGINSKDTEWAPEIQKRYGRMDVKRKPCRTCGDSFNQKSIKTIFEKIDIHPYLYLSISIYFDMNFDLQRILKREFLHLDAMNCTPSSDIY